MLTPLLKKIFFGTHMFGWFQNEKSDTTFTSVVRFLCDVGIQYYA